MAAALMGLAASCAAQPADSPAPAPVQIEGAKMPGGAFNLRIVSDSVPDWSSRENFVKSALSGWKTDEEKAIAQFRWMHRCRRVGSFAPEDSRPVLDPILFFNSYGITFCSMIAEMNISLWEARGLKGRLINLPGHVVSEVFYDGAWHMFDNDFCNYFINEKGQVAGAEELGASRIHGDTQNLKPGEYYIFDHCPTASAPRGHIFQGPNSWWIIEVARDWYPNSKEVKPRLDVTGAHAGHRFILGLRPNESYTRHWRPLGTGVNYARLFSNGKDPAEDGGSPLRNSRGNGEWVWTPDLSDPSVLFASENVECTKDGIKAKDPAKPASATFRVMAGNVATSATVLLWPQRMRVGKEPFTLSVSGNGGLSWSPVVLTQTESRLTEFRGTFAEPIAGRLEYLLKVAFAAETGLRFIQVNTITQVNPRTLPALKLGKNEIAAVSDEQLEYITLNPRLTGGQFSKEVVKAEGWQSLDHPRDWEASIRAVGKAELVLKAAAPRDIRRVRMACTAQMAEPSAELELSVNGGKEWKSLGKVEFPGSPHDRRVSFETRDFPAGTREVLMRYAFDGGGSGLINVFAEVGYEPAGGFMPYDISYSWSEWRGGKWVERRHLEHVASAAHRYAINVGGERTPKMNWMKIAPAGKDKAGYADGEDVGDKFARPAYRLVYGENLSVGCAYEVSRPASQAFPDKGGRLTGVPADRLLTDGFIGESSVWKLDNINLTGKKNEKRVGELVVWEPGEPVTITVDLGKVRTVGAARVSAIQPNPAVLYPAVMAVETSADGKAFAAAGQAAWDDCLNPPADQMQWSGFDSPVYEGLPAGGMISYRFPILFTKPVEARYVRFKLAAPADPKAAVGLYEVDVWDKIEKQPWDERLQLPAAGK
ncbi:MAG TPA: hypothetical protein PK280_08200 [Planctomycetota bacterium]|nr:hypothetical protein [Planctomycetota bacterium]